MQVVNSSTPAVTIQNFRLTNIAPDFYPSSHISFERSSPQLLSLQKHRIQQNPENHQNHAVSDCLLQRNGYSIHLVSSLMQRIKANTLIKRMYASRGYQTESASVFSADPSQYTLEAQQSGQLIGTLTLAIDTDTGLLADTLYRTELDQFRRQGHRLCELSKLAFNPESSSKEIFASLFHMAYIFARHIHNVDDAFIEINPRHAAFYKRMLGFRQVGELRTCPRVNAPAVLLHLDLAYMKKQIATQAEQFDLKTRSIYPHFLSRNKEREITRLIQSKQTSHTTPFLIHKSNPTSHHPSYLRPA
ncbi:long-chain N-acyl amino acid synthase [Nitrosomonas sp.]|uniref:N-acyl amino acid synthase FeeM domain-containing protein n=1 Tax=Nitrosomonas sp. TaxID=42353 RepID=UPI0025D8FF7B|nr:long-chain N-acyl amino acid synthase [Nitrosomonas sp.]